MRAARSSAARRSTQVGSFLALEEIAVRNDDGPHGASAEFVFPCQAISRAEARSRVLSGDAT
jgi:hypothetical protein